MTCAITSTHSSAMVMGCWWTGLLRIVGARSLQVRLFATAQLGVFFSREVNGFRQTYNGQMSGPTE
jgi:hypothetical protein